MAFVQMRAAAVREYGLPQACPCCGNDDDGQLVLEPVGSSLSNGWRYGCCLVSFFFGPIGWLLGVLSLLSKSTELPFPLPICRLCREAKSSLSKRACLIAIISTLSFFCGVFAQALPARELVGGLGFLAGLFGIIEYFYFRRQFLVRARKSTQDTALVEVPYEEYPALYQRHLDNAVLYGSSEKLGTRDEH